MSVEHTRTLICGLGSIGRRHMRTILKLHPEHEIAVLRSGNGYKSNEEKLARKTFTNMKDAIEWEPQAAIICTPATDHLTKAIQLARKNIPTLIEKPIGSDLQDEHLWKELETRAKTVPILIGYVLRHDECAKIVRERINSGVLGKIIEADFYCGSWLPDWRPNQDYRSCVSAKHELGGGVLLELSHEIDLAQWLLGSFDVDHTYMTNSGLLEINVEDQAIIIGRTKTNTSVSIRINFCTNPPKRSVVIRGENKEIIWDLNKGRIKIEGVDSRNEEIYQSNSCINGRYENQTKHFFLCVNNKTKPDCTVRDGVKVLKMIREAKIMFNKKR